MRSACELENPCVRRRREVRHTILPAIVGMRGAINGLMAEVIEGHLRTHIAGPDVASEAECVRGVELIDELRSYLK